MWRADQSHPYVFVGHLLQYLMSWDECMWRHNPGDQQQCKIKSVAKDLKGQHNPKKNSSQLVFLHFSKM